MAICVKAVEIANALPTIGQAESQEEIDSALAHRPLKRFVNTWFIEAVFGEVIAMQRQEILCILCGLFGEELAKEVRAAMLLAFQASGRHIDMPKRKQKRPKRQPKYKSMIIEKQMVIGCVPVVAGPLEIASDGSLCKRIFYLALCPKGWS